MTMGWALVLDGCRASLRRVGARIVSGLLLGFVAATMLSPSPARAWWNDEWQLRKKITIDAGAVGGNITDQIGDTPVLVRLHAGNFRFSATKDDGSDLRFVAGDDKTPLKFHMERYDPLLAEALIWVAVPNLAPGAKTEIWLYYGNKKAVPTSDPKATYDPDMQLVYHFNERGTPALDSSVWANNAQAVGQPAEGALIGTGLRLDGRSPLALPASSSLALADNSPFTWSAWIKPAAWQVNAAIYSRHDGANAFVIGLDNGAPFIELTNAGAVQRSAAGTPVAPNGWHHLAVVVGGGQIAIYLDGSPYASLTGTMPALNTVAFVGSDSASPAAPSTAPSAAAQPDSPGAAVAGSDTSPTPDAAAPAATSTPAQMTGFAGDIDELQISKVARPVGFIKFAAVNQGPDPSKLMAFSVDEETASWLSGYFAVILKSVTLDGWVVIGMLLIMAAISWIVMIDKASFLRKQARANTQFMKGFREIAADLTVLDCGDADEVSSLGGQLSAAEEKTMRASSLYRIYHIGAAEIRQRFARRTGAQPMLLSAASIAAIRASLDSGVVKELQRLNRLMVVLTIAISGGPFLGLLGTVVGVMITFAAIAASGDVNVNAIAPGIAAALVATVAGLGVAIPALFGYNYLISQIKDLTSEIQVFVDEFVTKMAEYYSADRPDPIGQQMAAE